MWNKIQRIYVGTNQVWPKPWLWNSLPWSITDTNMLMNMKWWNNSYSDLTGHCSYSLNTGSITYLNDWDNYAWQFNSANIFITWQTIYAKNVARFYSLWHKSTWDWNRVFNFTQDSAWSQLYLSIVSDWCRFWREESNVWWVWSYTVSWLINSWHLYWIWYDWAWTSVLYLDWVQVASKTNTGSWYWCTPINQNIGSNGKKTCQNYYEWFMKWQVWQFLIYTSRPSDADILAYYELTKPLS